MQAYGVRTRKNIATDKFPNSCACELHHRSVPHAPTHVADVDLAPKCTLPSPECKMSSMQWLHAGILMKWII